MQAQPINIQTHKLWFESSKLHINTTQTYEVTDDIRKTSSKILNDWLKKARLTLRVLGGDSNYPFLTAESVAGKHNSRRFMHCHNFEILIDHYKQNKNTKTSSDCLTEIILKDKMDVVSLSHALRNASWGEQKWINVCNRFKKEYRPVLMLHLLNGGTL
jgi:hypothetical protein